MSDQEAEMNDWKTAGVMVAFALAGGAMQIILWHEEGRSVGQALIHEPGSWVAYLLIFGGLMERALRRGTRKEMR